MDISDWFYIVFLLISILAGVFGKKKKKGGAESVYEQQLRRTFNLDPEPDDEVVETQYRSSKEVFIDEPRMVFKSDPIKTATSSYSKYSGILHESIDTSKKTIARDAIKMQEIKSDTGHKESIKWDLRKMILYDAIINRPKF